MDLQEYIEHTILPQYDTFDGGHKRDHAEAVIARTMAYSAKLYPDGDFETLYARSREHLMEKYAEGGYMRLWLNSERNVRSLEALRAIIRNEPLLRSLCEQWYKVNTGN